MMRKHFMSLCLAILFLISIIPGVGSASAAETANAGNAAASNQVLLVKADAKSKTAVKLSWTKVTGATGYTVYAKLQSGKFVKLQTLKKTSLTVKKINGKKLTGGKYCSFYVIAQKGTKKLVQSATICVITGNQSGKYGNVSSLSFTEKSISLNPGQVKSLKVKTRIYKGKKHLPKKYGNALTWFSSDPTVVAVSASGKISAVKPGTAVIYVQELGGRYCSLKVTVKANSFVVTYNANGGVGAPASQKKVNGSALLLSTAVPSRSWTVTFNNHGALSEQKVYAAFKSWNTAENGSGMDYDPGSEYRKNASVTLYAMWDPAAVGTLPDPDPIGGECSFIGWYTAPEGGTRITSSTVVTSDVTYYARWEECPPLPPINLVNMYTLTFNANGGTGAPESIWEQEGKNIALPAAKPARSHTLRFDNGHGSVTTMTVNCTFREWNTKKSGTGTAYAAGASYTVHANETLYAMWNFPVVCSLPAPEPIGDGYSFIGWFTSDDPDHATRIGDCVTVSEDATYYAWWQSDARDNISDDWADFED